MSKQYHLLPRVLSCLTVSQIPAQHLDHQNSNKFSGEGSSSSKQQGVLEQKSFPGIPYDCSGYRFSGFYCATLPTADASHSSRRLSTRVGHIRHAISRMTRCRGSRKPKDSTKVWILSRPKSTPTHPTRLLRIQYSYL